MSQQMDSGFEQYILQCRAPMTGNQVGGKFSKQHEMLASGLPVPPFFCLTIDCYQQVFVVLEAMIREKLDAIDFKDHQSIQRGSDAVQQLFADYEFSESQENAIVKAFDAQFKDASLVSVRASTVGHILEESEDSANNPFAGMSESFLYVPRYQVPEKIKQCWGSGFSQESLIYRHAQGMNLLGFGVAVGVQQMVFGERSFVLFTADPKTAARDQVIVAGYGIGEGVVQEKVPVDHYFVSGKTGQINHELADKTTRLTMDEVKGFGLIERPVPEAEQEIACLTDKEITYLVSVGAQIESLFKCPQDIEGCFTAEGHLYILQSRPIALDYARQLIWTNSNVTESYPGVSTVLTYTFAKFFYREIFYDAYRRLGVSARMINDNFEPLDKMIGYLNGRVFYCLSHFYLLHKQSPLYPLFGAHWENMIGLSSSYQSHTEVSAFSRWMEKARIWSRVGVNAVATFFNYLDHDRTMYHYHSWWERRISALRGKNFTNEDPLTLVNLFHEVWRETGNEWGVTLTTDSYLIPMYGLAETLFKKWQLDEDPGLLSDLLCGDESLQSVEIILSAVRLAEVVRADAELASVFAREKAETLWDLLDAGDLDDEFSEKVRHHLHYFGDRGLQELKLEQPSLRDTPWVLMRMIKQYAAQNVTAESIIENERSVRQEADKKLEALLAEHPRRKALLNKIILPRLRRLIRHRENSRYCRSELFGFSRNIFKALGQYLVSQNVLKSLDDVYHLTQDEVFGYIDGTGVTEDLQSIADIRRKEYQANLKKDVAATITTIGAVRENNLLPPLSETEGFDGQELRGLGSSAGKVTGIARVVHDPNNAGPITNGMILIAKETDPGWLFLMLACKGMVVERGSMLSHTAITGRKFGIPTIVALPAATTRIPDGAKIEIDGSSGLVRILDETDS
jgi:pyruvate,water dikinase